MGSSGGWVRLVGSRLRGPNGPGRSGHSETVSTLAEDVVRMPLIQTLHSGSAPIATPHDERVRIVIHR